LGSYLDFGSNKDPSIFFGECQSISHRYLENFSRIFRNCDLIPFSYFTRPDYLGHVVTKNKHNRKLFKRFCILKYLLTRKPRMVNIDDYR